MLQLLLPALVPSWRFFDRIGPAPHVEFSRSATADDASGTWQEVRPRPVHVPPAALVARLFWNPRWNESLYLVSCAERLIDAPSPERATAFCALVATLVRADHPAATTDRTPFLRVRIVEVMREHDRVVRQVPFTSAAFRVDDAREPSPT